MLTKRFLFICVILFGFESGLTHQRFLQKVKACVLGACISLTNSAIADSSSLLDQTRIQLPPVNFVGDDFWYPPVVLGRWKTDLTFDKAEFISNIQPDQGANSKLLGLDKYSIFMFPKIGKDIIDIERKFVSLDSHPREEHSFNLRQFMKNLSPETIIDDASYSYQKAPIWFYSPANKWSISFHTNTANGKVLLNTRKRDINVFAGTVETTEYIDQVKFVVFFFILFFMLCYYYFFCFQIKNFK
jgi:hypothetical protein